MDYKQSTDHMVDQKIKSYSQGRVISAGYVYLGCCSIYFFDELPWRSKVAFESFLVKRTNGITEYVHVKVAVNEWNNLVKHESDGYKLVVQSVDNNFSDENEPIVYQKKILKPKPVKKKDAIEWQRRRLIRVLSQVVHKHKMEERKKRRIEKVMTNYVKIDLRRTKPVPDPNINTYCYDIVIKVSGELNIMTTDLNHKARIATGEYKARLVKMDNDAWLLMRYPRDVGNLEYGLTVRQWKQYERNDGMAASVRIIGLE